MTDYIKNVLENMPTDWLNLTTHRLDIYNEPLAKIEFLQHFEEVVKNGNITTSTLEELPTAYDYIRLGHPLSCVLEWAIAEQINVDPLSVISFSSQTMPVLAVLRANHFKGQKTQIIYEDKLPDGFDPEVIKRLYGYNFEITNESVNADFEGSTILITTREIKDVFSSSTSADFVVSLYDVLGSIIVVNSDDSQNYISEIQHVRRRESIAMTPSNCILALKVFVGESAIRSSEATNTHLSSVRQTINEITGTSGKPLVGSSGLSIQYAIMMGLVQDALDTHPGKAIKFVVPPNCYGGTNDQARRVAAVLGNVEIVDLPVDGDNDMVQSVNKVLDQIAMEDAIPYIIAEIPTNPRVEVPNLDALREALSKERKTPSGATAIVPVFILDQTFCPNVQFLADGGILAGVRTISYASGSKFPSGGKCTAGYCVGNGITQDLMEKIDLHLSLCDNEATAHQIEILGEQMPSMNQRISDAYKNTRSFVNYIEEVLPDAKINFVSEELAAQGFTPSVFSLDLPTIGDSPEEREIHKRSLNHKLINRMISLIPNESKYCVSYGQLKGCYWTIPATSTQGTTKEGDKDYIARVAVSPNLDLDKHKEVLKDFVEAEIN